LGLVGGKSSATLVVRAIDRRKIGGGFTTISSARALPLGLVGNLFQGADHQTSAAHSMAACDFNIRIEILKGRRATPRV